MAKTSTPKPDPNKGSVAEAVGHFFTQEGTAERTAAVAPIWKWLTTPAGSKKSNWDEGAKQVKKVWQDTNSNINKAVAPAFDAPAGGYTPVNPLQPGKADVDRDSLKPIDYSGPVTNGFLTGQATPDQNKKQAAVTDRENSNNAFTGLGKTTNTELTDEQYNALSPRQQSLVLAQTQLWDAIQSDLANDKTLDKTSRKAAVSDSSYEGALTSLFGDQGGSDTYAPKTVATLKALGLGDKAGDLDNYLSGAALLNDNDIKGVVDTLPNPTTSKSTQEGYRLASAGENNPEISTLLRQGSSILSSFQGNKDYSFAGIGEDQTKEPSVLDNLNSDQLTGLQNLMQGMTYRDTPADLGNYYDSLKSIGVTPDIVQAYLKSSLDSYTPDDQVGQGYLKADEFRTKWSVN